jgi:ribosome-associated translation inhibitor RaiA
VEEVPSRLDKYGARISVIEVSFDEEKKTKKVEGILPIDRSAPIVATGEGDEFSEALSQVNGRLGRQLQKQVKDHRALPLTEALSEE